MFSYFLSASCLKSIPRMCCYSNVTVMKEMIKEITKEFMKEIMKEVMIHYRDIERYNERDI